MSRAALWKQQEKVREREGRATSLFQEALEQGRQRVHKHKSSIVPLWGPDDGTFHWNPVLLQNTINNSYFQTCCESLQDWNAIVDEIYNQDLRHLQPRAGGAASSSAPSTAFCLLLRLLLYRMTASQLHETLSHPDSVYIQAIGFLYVRYACVPEQVLALVEPYLLDPTEINVESNSSKGRGPQMTLGEFVRKLFGSGFGGSGHRDYFGTPLPRYPTPIERDIQVKVLHCDKIHDRAIRHLKHPTRISRDFTVGSRVRALYGDDDHPVEWYDAVIDRIIHQDPDTGRALLHPKFVVTYTEYGNTETVTLGELDVVGGPDSSSNNGDRGRRPVGRGYDDRVDYGDRDRDRDRDQRQLYDEVRRREQESAAASHRSGWAAKRPPTTKAALSSGGSGGGGASATAARDRYYYPSEGPDDDDRRRRRWHGDPHDYDRRRRDMDNMKERDRSSQDRRSTTSSPSHTDAPRQQHRPSTPPQQPHEPPRKRSAEEIAAAEEKKRRLLSKYG